MKRIASLILLLSFAFSLSGCVKNAGDGTTVPETDPETAPETTTEEPVPTGDEVTVPNEKSVTLTPSDLGLDPWLADGIDPSLLSVETLEDGSIRLTALRPFEGVLTVRNVYAEEATVALSAGKRLDLEAKITPFVIGKHINAADKGLRSGTDATVIIQKCIDALSDEGGGTVYLPAGKYTLGSITMKPGVALRLAGFPRKATNGYDLQTRRDYSYGVFAVITTNGSSRNNIFVYNTPLPQAYCTEGTSDFSVSGGFWDCQSKMKWSATACGKNIVFENAVIKDLPNNHAMQVDGCENFTVRNVMFAGYTFPTDGVLTRETIQLESTTPGAITSDHANSPILAENGDYHSCRNVTVEGCYFGKSDKSGSQLVALGHHSSAGSLICDGLDFRDNVIDNPLFCGLHLPNMINVRITGNRFISNQKSTSASLGNDSALISLYSFSSDNTFSHNGKQFCHAFSYEHPGCQNYVIEDNEFTVGNGTFLRALKITGASISNRNSATYLTSSDYYRYESFGGTAFKISGYVLRRNVAANITFRNNSIDITARPAYDDCFVSLKNVLGFFESGTSITLGNSASFSSEDLGIRGFQIVDKSVITSRATLNVRKVTLTPKAVAAFAIAYGDSTVTVPNPSASATVTFRCEENGNLFFEADVRGNLTLRVVPDEGYSFAGWKDEAGNPADPSAKGSETRVYYAIMNKSK